MIRNLVTQDFYISLSSRELQRHLSVLLFVDGMASLKIASKANQATTFPALLIANYAQILDSKVSIKVEFEEVEFLKNGDKAALELDVGSGPTFGTKNVIHRLLHTHQSLKSKNPNLVG